MGKGEYVKDKIKSTLVSTQANINRDVHVRAENEKTNLKNGIVDGRNESKKHSEGKACSVAARRRIAARTARRPLRNGRISFANPDGNVT